MAKGGLGQLTEKGARESRNSLPAEPRMGLISRLERVPGTEATHHLQRQEWALSAGLKGCQRLQKLTDCRAKNGLGQHV